MILKYFSVLYLCLTLSFCFSPSLSLNCRHVSFPCFFLSISHNFFLALYLPLCFSVLSGFSLGSLSALSRFSLGSLSVPSRFPLGSLSVPSRFSLGSLSVLSRFSLGSLSALSRFQKKISISPSVFQPEAFSLTHTHYTATIFLSLSLPLCISASVWPAALIFIKCTLYLHTTLDYKVRKKLEHSCLLNSCYMMWSVDFESIFFKCYKILG